MYMSLYHTFMVFMTHLALFQWVNGQELMRHTGGHLPFEAQLKDQLISSTVNRLTVAVNNTLTPHTLPPGSIEYKTDTFRLVSAK